MKWVKKPVVVDARRYDGSAESAAECGLTNRMPDDCTWAEPRVALVESLNPHTNIGSTIEVHAGDWVITQDMGDWQDRWPVRPDVFAQTYAPTWEGVAEWMQEFLDAPSRAHPADNEEKKP